MSRLSRRLERFYRGTISGKQLLDKLSSFPTVDLEAVTGGSPVLILAPHADDESLGCGGLIAEACQRGQAVHVVVLSDGTASHPGSKAYPASVLAALRKQEALDALACLGLAAEHTSFLGLPDGQLPQGFFKTRAVARQLHQIGKRVGAGTVLATWRFDLHPDHVATNRYGRLVSAALGASFYTYPVWGLLLGEQVRLPAVNLTGVALNIASHVAVKRRAVMAHRSQTSRLIDDADNNFELNAEQLKQLITDYERYIFEK